MKMEKRRSFESLLMLATFGIFTLLAVLLVLMGARVYQRISGRMEENNALRASLSYVANKVRGGDRAGGVALDERGGVPMICLSETLDGTVYETLLYFSDGWLWEYEGVRFEGDDSFHPENGEKIVELQSFQAVLEGGQLLLTAQGQNGKALSLQLTLRSDGGAV